MADGGYPYGDLPRALEQMGWLKAQMELSATKEDLANMRGDLKEFIRDDAEKRDKAMLGHLTEAFKLAMPGTQAMVDDRIQSQLADKQSEFEAKLKKKGLRIGETGDVEHMVNPVVKLVRKNMAYVGVMVVAATIVNPNLTYSAARMLWEFIT